MNLYLPNWILSFIRSHDWIIFMLTITSTTDDDDVDPDQDTPHKPKRKKKVFEDVHARDLRERDRERLAAQKERRQRLLDSQIEMGDQGGDGGDIIINESKLDKEGFVYVYPKIARRIKKHQIEGVRFMWNQIVTAENAAEENAIDEDAVDESTLSGCLLAHTMGLGKTMQV
jgi:SNF2 family DNA or RNA helicase